MRDIDSVVSVALTCVFAGLFLGGALCHSDRVQYAAIVALCWNVGWDFGVMRRERLQKNKKGAAAS